MVGYAKFLYQQEGFVVSTPHADLPASEITVYPGSTAKGLHHRTSVMIRFRRPSVESAKRLSDPQCPRRAQNFWHRASSGPLVAISNPITDRTVCNRLWGEVSMDK